MIHIRGAEQEDFAAICMLMKNELGYPGLNEAGAVRRLEYFSQCDDRATFVAVIDNEVSGFIGIKKGMEYTIDGFCAEILILAVSEKTRRSGVGTALVKKAEEWAYQNNAFEIGLHSNFKRQGAHIFYERNGYIKGSYWFYKKLDGLI